MTLILESFGRLCLILAWTCVCVAACGAVALVIGMAIEVVEVFWIGVAVGALVSAKTFHTAFRLD